MAVAEPNALDAEPNGRLIARMNLELLNSEETVSRLHAIIKGAKKELFLVSPYMKLDENDRMIQSIRLAASNGVRVTLVMRIRDDGSFDDPTAADIAAFEAFEKRGLHFRFVPWLHAKLYWSESAVLMTSMNLLSSSIQKSIEVGTYSDQPADLARARSYFDSEIAPFARTIATRARAARGGAGQSTVSTQSAAATGHCIRCHDEIAFNPKKPYCADDYESWAEYGNEDYGDKFCHQCGKKHRATMRKPLCGDCYGASQSL